MRNSPRVAVLVPTHNREKLLPRCLDSICRQTLEDWVCVVGDDASTDRSADVVREFDDPRIRLMVRPHNVGHIENHNLLLREVEADFVAFLHSDDWWEPEFLELMVAALEGVPSALTAISTARLVYGSGAPSRVERLDRAWPLTGGVVLSSPEAARLLIRRWPYLTPSHFLARRELYESVGGFDLRILSCDQLLLLRAASNGDIAFRHEPLVNTFKHTASITGDAEWQLAWADDWNKLARIVEEEWRGGHEPYPGALRELSAMNTMRFLIKTCLMVEEGDRGSAVRLAAIARRSARGPGWRLLAGVWSVLLPLLRPGVFRGLRKVMGRWRRPASGRAGAAAQRRSPEHYLAWAIRDAWLALREGAA